MRDIGLNSVVPYAARTQAYCLTCLNLCLSCQYEFILSNKQCWELCTFHDCTRILYAALDDISSLLGNIEECLIVMKDKVICLKHLAQNKRSENINYFCFPQSLFSRPWLPSHISVGCYGFVCFFFFFLIKAVTNNSFCLLDFSTKINSKVDYFPLYLLIFTSLLEDLITSILLFPMRSIKKSCLVM